MQNLSAFELALARLCLFLSVSLGLALTPRFALADARQECSSAYDQTQALRKAGKLDEAHRQAALCMRDTCKDFIRSDCTKWLGEIEAVQPTVVFQVKDTAGRDATAVSVMLDGRPWLDHLDGTAKPIDPGQHTLRYTMVGSPPIDDTVLIRESEKGRALVASFQNPKGTGAGASAHSPGPFIVGGVGVAVLIGAAVTGALVLQDKSVTDKHCFASTMTCDATGESAASRGRVLGPVTTVELAVGGAALAGGVIWLAVDRSGPKRTGSAVRVLPVAGNRVGALLVEGAW